MNTEALQTYKTIFNTEADHILSFWLEHVVDLKKGIIHGEVDLTGKPIIGAPKGCILIARILWVYSAAARIFKKPEYQQAADLALQVVQEGFRDKEYGGYYAQITDDLKPDDTIKHLYIQAFVLYSLCEYYRLSPSDTLMHEIQTFFALLQEKAKDHDAPGYLESFDRQWVPITQNQLSDHDEPKSMNTHLHLLEAYTSLYRVWQDKQSYDALAAMIDIFLNNIISDAYAFRLFFEKNFTESEHSKGIVSFGHDIEGQWLLVEAAEVLGDAPIIKTAKTVAIKMVDAVEKTGLDRNGGLFLESTRYGSHVKTNKHWWIQAETVVGFMNAYQLTGDEKYWEIVKQTWAFIDQHIIDKQYGEWFPKVSRLGVPFLEETEADPSPYYRNDRKADPWKCPYHNARMCYEMIDRIEQLLR